MAADLGALGFWTRAFRLQAFPRANGFYAVGATIITNRSRAVYHFFKKPIRIVAISGKRHHQMPLPFVVAPKAGSLRHALSRRVAKFLELRYDLSLSDDWQ